jgi:hypothetical protein
VTLYRQKPPVVEATIYSASLPQFEPYLITQEKLDLWGYTLDGIDPDCGSSWAEHAWMGTIYDGTIVHPGDYITTTDQWGNTDLLQPSRPSDFNVRWELPPTA